ncbi:MAG: hypothetical protein Q9209_002103 [Squamulea sp. 1 TL-2023]
MASHSLAIAKASLAAGLMRPDLSAASKTDIAQFHRLLDALILQCSTTNIQLCTEWLLKHTAPSADKLKAVGKYLVAISASLSPTLGSNGLGPTRELKASSRRQQLHILYLIHDLLHYTKFHGAQWADGTSTARTLETHVVQLVTLTATYDQGIYRHHFARLNDLINIWAESNYFPSSVVAALRDTVTSASCGDFSAVKTTEPSATSIDTAGNNTGERQKDLPYIMPASHGDASVPYYDLPAGNLMPCIIPNSLTPISPQTVKPLQFRAGPADEKLARAVKTFLQDINIIYGAHSPEQSYDTLDIDELGQPIVLENAPGHIEATEGYYGWSKAFCEKMKLRSTDNQRAGSPLHPRMSQQLHKRRRGSSSYSDRSLSRSSATSRSLSRGRETGHRRRRDSDARSRSPSRRRPYHMGEATRAVHQPGPASSRSRSGSYSPPDVVASQHRVARSEDIEIPKLFQNHFSQAAPPPPAFLQQGFLGPGQIPVPPPPPPNYTGPWPPPPPPPPPLSAPTLSSRMSQESPSMPPLPTYAPINSASPQLSSQVSGIGSAPTAHGQTPTDIPSQDHQSITNNRPFQPGQRQAPPSGRVQVQRGQR